MAKGIPKLPKCSCTEIVDCDACIRWVELHAYEAECKELEKECNRLGLSIGRVADHYISCSLDEIRKREQLENLLTRFKGVVSYDILGEVWIDMADGKKLELMKLKPKEAVIFSVCVREPDEPA